MSFHAHTGGSYQGFTPLAVSTFDTLLDDIVADVAAAVAAGKANGWELWDDQRTLAGHAGGVYATPVAIGGYAEDQVLGVAVTAGSAAINVTATTGAGRLLRRFVPGWSEVAQAAGDTPAGATWYGIASVSADGTAALSAPWAGTTQSNRRDFVEKIAGYVVLKCTSAQRTFYVQIVRPRSYGDALRVRALAEWDRVAHAPGGTGRSSNTEILRAYPSAQSGTGSVRYVLWLLPEAFAIWTEGHPTSEEGSDFAYVGNLDPARAGDTWGLALLCTNTELSGWGPACGSSTQSIGADSNGGVQLLRNFGGDQEWAHLSQATMAPAATVGAIYARAPLYMGDPYRLLLDDTNSLPMAAVDVYEAGPKGAASSSGRRGELRHLRIPCGNPSGQHLVAFGPDLDGHSYLMIRTGRPYGRSKNNVFPWEGFSNATVGGESSPICCSAFATALRFTTTYNEVVVNSSPGAWYSRWFLLPMDL